MLCKLNVYLVHFSRYETSGTLYNQTPFFVLHPVRKYVIGSRKSWLVVYWLYWNFKGIFTNFNFCFLKIISSYCIATRCDNKNCIGKQWLCDGDDDCLDFSDEGTRANCTNTTCRQKDGFWCESSKVCIRVEYKCDGEKDCSDGSDEKGKYKHISISIFSPYLYMKDTFTIAKIMLRLG